MVSVLRKHWQWLNDGGADVGGTIMAGNRVLIKGWRLVQLAAGGTRL